METPTYCQSPAVRRLFDKGGGTSPARDSPGCWTPQGPGCWTPQGPGCWTPQGPGCRTNSAETPRKTLIKTTEHAIRQFIQDDIETNLAMIQTLEDISYKLMVESNTSFLEESLCSNLTEDEDWQWDEDCFFDSVPIASAPALPETGCDECSDVNTSISSCSSLCSSVRPCDESSCYLGYLASSEWEESLTDSTGCETGSPANCDIPESETGSQVKCSSPGCKPCQQMKCDELECEPYSGVTFKASATEVDDQCEEWVVVPSGYSFQDCDDTDWVVITASKAGDTLCETVDSEEYATEEDWAVLSFRVTETNMLTHEQYPENKCTCNVSSGYSKPRDDSQDAKVLTVSGVSRLKVAIRTFAEYLTTSVLNVMFWHSFYR